jgi:hypothetical protein
MVVLYVAGGSIGYRGAQVGSKIAVTVPASV